MTACGGGGVPSSPPDGVRDVSSVTPIVDATPNDPLCWAASDASDGECYLRTLRGTRLKVVGNAAGKIFFSAEGDALMLYAYDLKTQHFIGRTTIKGFTPAAFAYSPDHGRLYVGDTHGGIHAYSEALVENNTVFAAVGSPVSGMVAAGKYLLVQALGTHSVLDKNGKLTDKEDWRSYSSYYEWAPNQERLYFFRDGTSPNDLMFEDIEQITGTVTLSGDSPYHGDYVIKGPIKANKSGSRVLLGSGDIYADAELNWSGKVPVSIVDAMWLEDDQLLITSPDSRGTRLHRYSSDLVKLEELVVDGEVLAMAQQGESSFLIVKKADHIEISPFVPSDDTDGDGVGNLQDKFPTDKTAAVDSDNDGYPDAWLNGFTAADSESGLALDAYPLDASCHAMAQGDGVRCSPALSIPSGAPDRVFSDNQGTVFLYSSTAGLMYRWSESAGIFLSPLAVGQPTNNGTIRPLSVTHSPAHGRIYLGYSTGQITYIALTGDSRESPFVAAAAAVRGLAAAGNFVLAQDESGAWATHSIFDKTGKLTDQRDWNAYSSAYDWAPNQNRVYFMRDDTSPNDLMFEEINPTTGAISASGESPYHGDYMVRGPVRVSLGGGRIALGSGNIYSTSDLTVVHSLGLDLVDMRWLDDGSLATLTLNGPDSRLRLYSSAFAIRHEQVVPGAPVAVIKLSNGVVVFTLVNGQTQATRVAF